MREMKRAGQSRPRMHFPLSFVHLFWQVWEEGERGAPVGEQGTAVTRRSAGRDRTTEMLVKPTTSTTDIVRRRI